MNTQIKKGILELCVLSMLGEKDMYGYELVSEISKNIHIAEGTIYPLLKRLKEAGYVSTYLIESNEGPSRKYYSLTERGSDIKNKLIMDWFSFIESVNIVIRRDNGNE